MKEKIVEIFESVQRIPYKCRAENPLDTNLRLPYANCNQKKIILRELLNSFEFETRDIDVIFDWADLPIPVDILRTLKMSGTLQKHHLLEALVGEKYIKIDSTWNPELESKDFPVTHHWDGISDTLQVTKGKIKFYDPQVHNIILPYFSEERLLFAKEFNKWLEW